jgi:hypothetical protein
MIATKCRVKAGKMSDTPDPDPETRCGLRLGRRETSPFPAGPLPSLPQEAETNRGSRGQARLFPEHPE